MQGGSNALYTRAARNKYKDIIMNNLQEAKMCLITYGSLETLREICFNLRPPS